MRALRVPYPFPETFPYIAQVRGLEHSGRIVDFPNRHISYILYDCKPVDVERCILEVLKAIEPIPVGEEPERVEIRFVD
jgi:hypothetical protein